MQTEYREFDELEYILRYPNGYKAGNKYPVIFFLHGAGTRGRDLDHLMTNPYFGDTEKYDDFPFITIAPQCCKNTWFDLFETVERLLLHIAEADYTDKERIYGMGPSMGGYATWQLAMSMPEIFAAIVPICGGGMYWNAPRLKNVPVWAFHGSIDPTVFPEESQKMVDAVNRSGGNARLTIYPETAHNAWSDTYANPEVFAWLLSHKNEDAPAAIDTFVGSAIYG